MLYFKCHCILGVVHLSDKTYPSQFQDYRLEICQECQGTGFHRHFYGVESAHIKRAAFNFLTKFYPVLFFEFQSDPEILELLSALGLVDVDEPLPLTPEATHLLNEKQRNFDV